MKKRFGVIASIVAAASFFSLITASVAWFEARTDVDFGTGYGSTAAAYFESGSGKSETEAYVISSPIHMYNLAWLQYLGQFNTTVSPTYFKLKNDIDMSTLGSALPPIGTQANPFIGIFDGQSHTISNLTVSNNLNDIAKHPSTVQALTGVSVVGFFGIVGNPQPIGINRGDTHLDYTELQVLDKLNLHHFNLQNVVVKSTTSQTLMGIVAGYVNGHDGTVHDIGVLNGSLQAAQGATCLQHFVDDDADDPARPISKFSLIGETEDTEWKEAYDDSGTGSGDGPGDDAGFGGSIDMKTMIRRVGYIITKSTTSLTYQNGYALTNSSFNFDGYVYLTRAGDNYEFYWKSNVNAAGTNGTYSIVYLKKNTYLPINVKISESGLDSDDEIIKQVTYRTSSYNWHINDYYNSHNSELTSASNTGYVVGGSTNSSGDVRLRITSIKEIQRSLGAGRQDSTNLYDDSKVKMLYYSVDQGKYCIVKDETNATAPTSSEISTTTYPIKDYSTDLGLVRYSAVRSQLGAMLSGSNALYGLGMQKAIKTNGYNSTTVTMDENFKITGKTGSNYSFLDSSINFSLSQSGYVSMVMGSYFYPSDPSSTGNKQNSPDLYKIERNSNNAITSVTKIKNVSINGDSISLADTAPSGYKTVYNSANNELPLARTLYYSEIPLPAGDYAIGTDSSGNISAYMIYLDIGANGNGGGGGTTPTGDYDLKNVRYVHQIVNNGSTDSSDDYIDILFKISTAGANGTVALYFSRHDATMLYYHQNGTATNVDVTVFIAKKTNIQDTESAVWTS